MVICPIALAVGCKKCPVFSVCPVKGIIGDYKPEPPSAREAAPARAATAKSKPAASTRRARTRRSRRK
jgi:hypothetical protein